MSDNKNNRTPIITITYAILEVIYIILGILAINSFLVTFIGVPFIIISIGLAAKYKHRAAIISGIIGQVFVPITLVSFYIISFGSTFTEIWILVQIFAAFIGLFISILEICLIYPLLFMYRNEEKSNSKRDSDKETQGSQKMSDNKHKTLIIIKLYIILTIISIILSISFLILTLLGVVLIIISIYSANKIEHRSAIALGAIGQIFNMFLLMPYILSPPVNNPFIPELLGVTYFITGIISLIIHLLEFCVINPLLIVYGKEGKIIQQEKTARFQVIGNLKQYFQEKKIARQESKQKTPIINRYYILLTIFFIIWGLIVFPIYIFAFWGVPFVIISIYLARKFEHLYAIISGMIGQVIIIFLLSLSISHPYNFQWEPILFGLIGIIFSLLEICVIYPQLYKYRYEEKIVQREKMTQDQAIAYIKEISNEYDSIMLNDISMNTEWRGEELTSLIETLIFSGELTAEIIDNRLLFDREALLAVSEAIEEANTELDEPTSEEREIGEQEADMASKEILSIKDKKGKTMKNVVSVDDIEKVLTPGELKELQQTEAEIGIEEMQINCIVHKGPVEGTNVYICPRCKTFYCVRCAKAVKKSGDTCWTCKGELTL